MRTLLPPTVEETPEDLHNDSTETHPAYAQISASRVSGHKFLYGSDFSHQHYMTITVRSSKRHRNLSNDWHHADPRGLITVALSEAQWATFVSTANVGFGVCCTLEDLNGKTVPGIDQPKAPRSNQFKQEMLAKMADAERAIAALKAKLEDANLSGKARTELLGLLGTVQSSYRSGMPFVAEQFEEHIEETTEKARIEISAYAMSVAHRTGLRVLREGGDPTTEGPVVELPALPTGKEVLPKGKG